jgi:hypothetical protein
MLVPKFEETKWDRIKDFARFPELRFLNKHWWIPPTLLGVAVWLAGGWSMLLIGFFLSTVLLWHGTFTINSLSHVFGSRRFRTTDTSRNNWLLALITCGEGWHNNHHHFCASANQGFYWWEIDVSYYVIKLMEALGLAWDVRNPSPGALARNRLDDENRASDTWLLSVLLLAVAVLLSKPDEKPKRPARRSTRRSRPQAGAAHEGAALASERTSASARRARWNCRSGRRWRVRRELMSSFKRCGGFMRAARSPCLRRSAFRASSRRCLFLDDIVRRSTPMSR